MNCYFEPEFNKLKTNKKMKKFLFAAILGLFTMSIVPTTSTLAQGAKPKKEKSLKAADATRGASDIKEDRNNDDSEKAKPAAKRGGACNIYFTNNTFYAVDVYVDGNYKGAIGSYGSGSVSVYGGYTSVYCVSAGRTKEWRTSANCNANWYLTLNY